MGGFGALSLAMRYPGTFSVAGAHSPALWQLPGPDFFGDAAYFANFNPVQLLHDRSGLARGLKLWVDIGASDPLEKARTEALHGQLVADAVPHQWHESPGEHNAAYWSAHVEDYLRFYDASLRPA